MNLVEVTTVAMLTEVKGRGGESPRAGFGRRTREGRERLELGARSREWEGRGREREGEGEGSLAVVTEILYWEDVPLCVWGKNRKKSK